MRCWWLTAFVAIVVTWIGIPTAHACSQPYTPLFARFERAQTVLIARVTSASPPRSARLGRARLEPSEAIAGLSAPVVVTFGNSSCDVRLRRSKTPLLVFLSADGRIPDAESVVPEPDAAVLASLRAWAGGSAADRAEQLVRLMDGAPLEDRLAREAVLSLGDADVRALFSAAQLERLDASARANVDRERDAELAQTYGRLASDFATAAFAEGVAVDELAAVIRTDSDAARIEAFEACGLRHGRIWHALGSKDDASWELRAQQCEAGVLQVDVALADIYRMSPSDFAAHDFSTETSTKALAAVMAAARGPAGFPRRAKAFERCTRLYEERIELDRDPVWVRVHALELPGELLGSLGPDTPERWWREAIAECRRGSQYIR